MGKADEETVDKTNNNIVTSLAEKAMSVAAPVVPMKEDGAVDHERCYNFHDMLLFFTSFFSQNPLVILFFLNRLVSILAELGQKGGILKVVAKVALLWGGIRGAISLTDRLISFLRIAERPLFQR